MKQSAKANSSSEDPPVRLSSVSSSQVEDDTLAKLNREVPASAFRSVPRDAQQPKDSPYDLAVAKPRAIDIRKLYKLTGQTIPADLKAALGPQVPLLLCHNLTPFYKGGEEPVGVWGMGYKCLLKDVDATTVSLFPESSLLDVAKVDQTLNFGLNVGGKIGVPKEGLELAAAVPGLNLTGVEVHATTNQNFALAIRCSFAVVEVQAGPVDAGGAAWNLYRASQRIDINQALFHTLLVPVGVDVISVKIETWVRRPRRLFNLFRAEHYHYPPVNYDISLAGL